MSRRFATCLRCCLVIFAVVSALCVSGPALYWKFKKGVKLKGISSSCPPCLCDCPSPQALFQIAPGLANLSVTDCGKDDPALKEEMEKQYVDLLSEELKLQETVGEAHSHHMNITFGRHEDWLLNTREKLKNAMLPLKLVSRPGKEPRLYSLRKRR